MDSGLPTRNLVHDLAEYDGLHVHLVVVDRAGTDIVQIALGSSIGIEPPKFGVQLDRRKRLICLVGIGSCLTLLLVAESRPLLPDAGPKRGRLAKELRHLGGILVIAESAVQFDDHTINLLA